MNAGPTPTVSCLACKKRKSKCSRGSPCDSCQRHTTECVYDVASDQRRRLANARNIYDLQWCRQFLGGIFALLKVGDLQVRDYFVTEIRNNKPIWDVSHYIEGLVRTEPAISSAYQHVCFELERPPDEKSNAPDLIPPIKSYLQFRAVQSPITMSSQPWTVLADDEMVSHLMSLFFTWQQPSFQYIDKTVFLAEMAAQTTPSSQKYCSPLLVNAILAQACSVSPRRTECQLLQTAFSHEAKRLLDLEDGRATLTTMQALLVLHSVECDKGKDRRGRIFHLQAMDMYKRLGFARRQSRPIGCDASEDTQQEWRALTRIIWATFCHDGFTALLYDFELTIDIPPVEQYFLISGDSIRVDLDDRDGYWTPYPIARPLQPSLLTLVLQAQCLLARIFHNVMLHIRPANGVTLPREATTSLPDQLDQLTLWKNNLDPRLGATDESMAHIYHLKIWYHAIHVVIARHAFNWPESELQISVNSVRELLFFHATVVVETVSQFRSAFSFQYSAGVGLVGPTITSYALIACLRHRADIPALFTRAVQSIREHGHLTIVPFLLAGLKVLEQRYETQMPQEVQSYMKVLQGFRPDWKNVAMEMPVVVHNLGRLGPKKSASHVPDVESMSDLLKGFSQNMVR